LLVILDLPPEYDQWLNVSVEALIIRRAANWFSLRGMDRDEERNFRNDFHTGVQYFDVDALRGLMQQSRQGRIG
jgi:hypothetical protein